MAESALSLLAPWKTVRAKRVVPNALVFSTRSGKPLAPNNVLRRWITPACQALNLRHATWLTFRWTYSTWSHGHGVRGKAVAQLMGPARVDTALNVYTQVLDAPVRSAADRVGAELFTIVHDRLLDRLRISSWCLTSTDSATTARAPSGAASSKGTKRSSIKR